MELSEQCVEILHKPCSRHVSLLCCSVLQAVLNGKDAVLILLTQNLTVQLANECHIHAGMRVRLYVRVRVCVCQDLALTAMLCDLLPQELTVSVLQAGVSAHTCVHCEDTLFSCKFLEKSFD